MKSFIIFFSLVFTLSGLFSCEDIEKEIPASEIYTNMPDDGYEVEIDSLLTISPKITYDYNSTYTWLLDGEVYSTEKDLKINTNTLTKYNFEFWVSNDRGSDSVAITVQSMYNSTFEDLTLYEEDTFSVNSTYENYFVSNKLIFEFEGEPESYSDFQGFAYSDLTGNRTDELDDIYSAYTVPDDDIYESEKFIVMHQNSTFSPAIIRTLDGKEHVFGNIKVINSYYNYSAIKYGTTDSKTFGGDDGKDEDYFMLTIKGYNLNNELTGTVEFYLADYRYFSNKEDYIIKEWTNVDISSIEACSRLELSLSSTDVSNGSMLTPAYVCLDEIKIIK